MTAPSDINTTRHAVTFFPDKWGKVQHREEMTLPEILQRMRETVAASKAELPLMKFAVFGTLRTESADCLRHDQNVQCVSGLEFDYDRGEISFRDGLEKMRLLGARGIHATTASHLPDKPRWRSFLPLRVPLVPPHDVDDPIAWLWEKRAALVRKVDAYCGSIFSRESQTLSPSYFFGSVVGQPPAQIEMTEGQFIDDIDLPDAPPMHVPVRGERRIKNGPPADRAEVEAALNAIAAKDDYQTWRDVGAALFDEFGDDGFDLYDAWSSQSPKYDKAKVRRKWRDCQAMTQISIASVFGFAKETDPNWRRALNGAQPNSVSLTDAAAKPMPKGNHGRRAIEHASDKGMPRPLLINAVAMMSDPVWEDVVVYDEFAMKILLQQAPPWGNADHWEPRHWSPYDDLKLTEWLQSKFVYVSLRIAEQAIALVAQSHPVHPIRQYLDGLVWDCVSRLDTWVRDHLGVADNRYSSAVGAKTLISAVARIYEPGAKVDNMMIWEGRQGALKSTALRALFRPWFTDEIGDFGSKDAAMAMSGVWCIEIAELDAMSRGETTRIKAFVSRQIDHFRPPYGSRVIDVPRQSIFVGTGNSSDYLKDETGGRRFLPLKIGRIDIAALKAARDQLWAEAAHRYRQGEKWWLENDIVRLAQDEQAERYVGDAWDEPIHAFLSTVQESTSVSEIFQYLGIVERDQSQVAQNRISRIMKFNGWVRFRPGSRQDRHWRYRKGPLAEETENAAPNHVILNTAQNLNAFITYAARLHGFLGENVPG